MSLRDFSLAADGVPADVMITPTHLDLQLKPASHNATQDIEIPGLRVTALPGAMRNMGWNVSAALMERWFASPAWRIPEGWKKSGKESTLPQVTTIPTSYVDEAIVTMAWALRFPRIRKVHEDLLQNVANPAAVERLTEHLKRMVRGDRGPLMLSDRSMSARELDENYQVNARPVGSSFDTLDDMYGALGFATMKIAVVGEVSRDSLSGRTSFHVNAAGTYIRDFYEFNGDQFLGLWTEDRVKSKAGLAAHAVLGMSVLLWGGDKIGIVTNQSFDAYRTRHGRGGDFVIFSDVHWTRLNVRIDLGIIK